MTLRLDFCSHKAAKHAVLRWHYSRAMPAAKLVKVGVWEHGKFVGVVLYGSGANRHIARPFGLQGTEVCELVRMALAPGRTYPTSKVLAISLRLLKVQCPGIRVVVSYADTKQDHVGTVYQATNWLFIEAANQPYLRVKGKIEHPRTLHARYGKGGQSLPWLRKNVDPRADRVEMPDKLKYVMPMDREMRTQLEPLAKPFIKKESRVGSIDSDVPAIQAGEGGASPTSTLQSSLESPLESPQGD